MPEAIINSSPLLYLHRIEAIEWIPRLFPSCWTTIAVKEELEDGRKKGCEVPDLAGLPWLEIRSSRGAPSEWLSLGLGRGEISVLALGLENPCRVVVMDDLLARRIAKGAGLEVWGTLRILLEAKKRA